VVIYLNNKQLIALLIAAGMLFYIGNTMFYNTGLGITDLNVENNSDGTQYEVSYMLRSVRNFEFLDCEYSLLTEDNQEIATGSTTLTNITDGSFNITETLSSNDSSKVPKQIDIRIYQEKFNPEQKNEDGSYSQDVFFEQKIQLN